MARCKNLYLANHKKERYGKWNYTDSKWHYQIRMWQTWNNTLINKFEPSDDMFFDNVHMNNKKGLPEIVKHLKTAMKMYPPGGPKISHQSSNGNQHMLRPQTMPSNRRFINNAPRDTPLQFVPNNLLHLLTCLRGSHRHWCGILMYNLIRWPPVQWLIHTVKLKLLANMSNS